MTSNTGAPVVVGVDGSEIALHAVRAAARRPRTGAVRCASCTRSSGR